VVKFKDRTETLMAKRRSPALCCFMLIRTHGEAGTIDRQEIMVTSTSVVAEERKEVVQLRI
jgi:hypothetical protein